MATTVTAADLTVTITEGISLNGVQYGNTINKTFSSQGEVIQRIMNIDTTFVDIFHTAAADARGTVVAADWAYFRITNLDDTNYMRLRLYNGTDSQFFKLSAGQSFLMMNPSIDAVCESTGFVAFANITQIAAQAPAEACDVEVVMVTA